MEEVHNMLNSRNKQYLHADIILRKKDQPGYELQEIIT
jgi:hypothetical protein